MPLFKSSSFFNLNSYWRLECKITFRIAKDIEKEICFVILIKNDCINYSWIWVFMLFLSGFFIFSKYQFIVSLSFPVQTSIFKIELINNTIVLNQSSNAKNIYICPSISSYRQRFFILKTRALNSSCLIICLRQNPIEKAKFSNLQKTAFLLIEYVQLFNILQVWSLKGTITFLAARIKENLRWSTIFLFEHIKLDLN